MSTMKLKFAQNISQGILDFRETNPKKVVEEKSILAKETEILAALSEFMECVRYLNTRRTKKTILGLSDENDVQDALFLMLRPWVRDLKYEEPTGKNANRFSIPDFVIPSAKMVVEAKFIRDKRHGKDVSKELHDDIEMYRHLSDCNRIVFFVFDPNNHIPSSESLSNQLCTPRSYSGKTINIDLIIKP